MRKSAKPQKHGKHPHVLSLELSSMHGASLGALENTCVLFALTSARRGLRFDGLKMRKLRKLQKAMHRNGNRKLACSWAAGFRFHAQSESCRAHSDIRSFEPVFMNRHCQARVIYIYIHINNSSASCSTHYTNETSPPPNLPSYLLSPHQQLNNSSSYHIHQCSSSSLSS